MFHLNTSVTRLQENFSEVVRNQNKVKVCGLEGKQSPW